MTVLLINVDDDYVYSFYIVNEVTKHASTHSSIGGILLLTNVYVSVHYFWRSDKKLK